MSAHLDYRFVKYEGKTDLKYGLQPGKVYEVTHHYGGNIGIDLGRTPNGRRIVSLPKTNFQGYHLKDLTLTDLFGEETPRIEVKSILTLNNQVLGVRFTSQALDIFDIELSKLVGLPSELANYYPHEELKPYEDLLMTEYEYTNRITASDLSDSENVCHYIMSTVFK